MVPVLSFNPNGVGTMLRQGGYCQKHDSILGKSRDIPKCYQNGSSPACILAPVQATKLAKTPSAAEGQAKPRAKPEKRTRCRIRPSRKPL